MAGYIIAEIEITDPETYEEYKKIAPASIDRFKGEYLARGGRTERLEGDWQPKRIVVLRFESFERAKEWWNSKEYRAPKLLRQSAALTRMIVVDGS